MKFFILPVKKAQSDKKKPKPKGKGKGKGKPTIKPVKGGKRPKK